MKENKNRDGRRAVKEEILPHPGNSLHWLGDQLGQMGGQGLEGRMWQPGLQQAEQRPAQRVLPTYLPGLPSGHAIHLMCMGAECWKLGLSGQTWGEDWVAAQETV